MTISGSTISLQEFNPADLSVAVLQGGRSVEREISLQTGANVSRGLRKLGFSVCCYDAADLDFIQSLRSNRPDFVFNALHGSLGEDGTIQGLLEVLDIPYTGSGVLASALAMDKQASKDIFNACNIVTPAGMVLQMDKLNFDEASRQLGASTLVVKPNKEGSSVGVSIVDNEADYRASFEAAVDSNGYALVEQCVPGREITVAVLGDAGRYGHGSPVALPVIEIIPRSDFYHYDNKYTSGATEYVVPAQLDDCIAAACQQMALDAHNAIGCQGYSRADIRLTDADKPHLLEINTLPGLTEHSLIPKAAASAGIELSDLLLRICYHAFLK